MSGVDDFDPCDPVVFGLVLVAGRVWLGFGVEPFILIMLRFGF